MPNYSFSKTEELLAEKPKPFKMERNLIPKKIVQYMEQGYSFINL